MAALGKIYRIVSSESKLGAIVSLESVRLSLVLKTPQPGDESIIQTILDNPENTKDDLSMVDLSQEAKRTIIESWINQSTPRQNCQFVIIEDGKPIGLAGLGWIGADARHGGTAGAVGIMINPEARGFGFANEALTIVMDYALGHLKLDRLVLGTISRNIAMRNLMEKIFEMPAAVTEPDRFGNDLEWTVLPQDLKRYLAKHENIE